MGVCMSSADLTAYDSYATETIHVESKNRHQSHISADLSKHNRQRSRSQPMIVESGTKPQKQVHLQQQASNILHLVLPKQDAVMHSTSGPASSTSVFSNAKESTFLTATPSDTSWLPASHSFGSNCLSLKASSGGISSRPVIDLTNFLPIGHTRLKHVPSSDDELLLPAGSQFLSPLTPRCDPNLSYETQHSPNVDNHHLAVPYKTAFTSTSIADPWNRLAVSSLSHSSVSHNGVTNDGFCSNSLLPGYAESNDANFDLPSISLSRSLYNTDSTVQTADVECFVNEMYGKKQINQYIVEAEIGKGTTAKVKRVLNLQDHRRYAMKIINKNFLKRRRAQKPGQFAESWNHALKEIAIMKKIRHSNIVRLYEVMDDEKSNNLYLIMEYMELGAVSVFSDELEADRLPLHICLKYFRDVVLALQYLHANKVVHRDIKPDNLLLSADGRVKIADFGVSMLFEGDDDRTSTTQGSSAFMAPEMIRRPDGAFSGMATDIWSLGVTLFAFVYGRLPFTDASVAMVYDKIVNQELQFPELPLIPNDLRLLLQRMLEKKWDQRISLPEVLNDPWVTEHGTWSPVVSQESSRAPIASTITNEEVKSAILAVNKLVIVVKLKSRIKKAIEAALSSASRRLIRSLPNSRAASPRS